MMIQAVLGNPHHPEYGVATIPFPIPHDQYAHCMELLEALEIGDAVKADCQVQEINSFYSVLKRMEMLTPEHASRPVTYASRQELFLRIDRAYGKKGTQPTQVQQAPVAERRSPYSAMGLYNEDTKT